MMNKTDFFTRLLAGIAYTRLAPASFYKDPSGPDRHFDGMCAPSLSVCQGAHWPLEDPAAVMSCVLPAWIPRGDSGTETCSGPP